MGAVATAVAQLTMGIQTAMPNVREMDVSISARNHEPESFTQFLDNHERRPLSEKEPPPKSLVTAMDLLSSVGARVEIPIAALMEEVGEESAIKQLLNNKATVRWKPTLTQPLVPNQRDKLPQPTLVDSSPVRPLEPEVPQEPIMPLEPVMPPDPVVPPRPVILEKSVKLVEPVRLNDPVQPSTPIISDRPALTEKQKVLAKLTALVPRANSSALSATQLTSEEFLRYKNTVPRVFKFLNQCPEEGGNPRLLKQPHVRSSQARAPPAG